MEPIREADVQTQPGKRLAEEPKRKKPGKAWKTAVGIVAAAVVVLFCVCCVVANTRSTFFPHTTINGVEVGGLTVAEAQSRLEAEIPQRVCKIYLSGQDGVSTEGREPDAVITFAELGLFPESGYEGMAKAPFILQQGKGYLSTALTYLEALLGKDTGCNSSLYWDSQQLDRAISELSSELNIEPLDMTYQLADHFLQITTARDGRFVADNELRRTIQNVVQNSSEAEAVVELPVEIRPAETLTARQLHDRLHGEMKNASYDAAAGTIIPEQPGADFDVAAVQKALDGAEVQTPSFYATRLWEVTKVINKTEHFYLIGSVVSGTTFRDSLSDDYQKLFADTFYAVGSEYQSKCAELSKQYEEEMVAQHGLTINEDVDVDAFKAATAPVYDELGYADIRAQVYAEMGL